MSSKILPTSTKFDAQSHAAQAAAARGTPAGAPVQAADSGIPLPSSVDSAGNTLYGGSYAVNKGQAGFNAALDPYRSKGYQPVTPGTALALRDGGSKDWLRRYLAGKLEQSKLMLNPLNGYENMRGAREARKDMPEGQQWRAGAGAGAGAIQAGTSLAMGLPVLRSLFASANFKRTPLLHAILTRNIPGAAMQLAKTVGMTALSDTPVEAAQHSLGVNPDSLAAQNTQNSTMAYLMGLATGSPMLRRMPALTAGVGLVDRLTRHLDVHRPGGWKEKIGGDSETTPDYTKLQNPAPVRKLERAAISRRVTEGLESRNLRNVATNPNESYGRRVGADVLNAVQYGLLNPGAVVDRWDEANRGKLAIENMVNATKSKPGTLGDEASKVSRRAEMDVLYRNMFSGKRRSFTWPGEDTPGVWKREDMPDQYANDPRRWGVTDKAYEQALMAQTKPLVGWSNKFLAPFEVPEPLSPATYRSPERAALHAKLYPEKSESFKEWLRNYFLGR